MVFLVLQQGGVLDNSTLVPVGVAAAGCLAIVSLVWRVSAKTTEVLHRLNTIDARLKQRWTHDEFVSWVAELRDKNPSLDVPWPKAKSDDE